jgi:uncharacterized Fe-S cluster-containing MiaB family protein
MMCSKLGMRVMNYKIFIPLRTKMELNCIYQSFTVEKSLLFVLKLQAMCKYYLQSKCRMCMHKINTVSAAL